MQATGRENLPDEFKVSAAGLRVELGQRSGTSPFFEGWSNNGMQRSAHTNDFIFCQRGRAPSDAWRWVATLTLMSEAGFDMAEVPRSFQGSV
jgi:hypothetical protein